MGAAIARELHERGYRLALMSPSQSAATLAGELSGVAVQGSAENPKDLRRLVDCAVEAFGRIDAVVNHTGHPPKGELLDITDENWMTGNEVLLMPVIRMARLVTPLMLRQRKGAYVNITTFAALEPTLAFPVSCAYRAAVSVFTKLFAERYAAENIRMNALLPGYIDSLAHAAGTAEKVPMRRIGTMREIAKTAAFLLSDDAGYLTGQSIRVDGGVTRHI